MAEKWRRQCRFCHGSREDINSNEALGARMDIPRGGARMPVDASEAMTPLSIRPEAGDALDGILEAPKS